MAAGFPILVKCFAGLEAVLAEEMTALGAREVHTRKRAVSCQGDLRTLYRLNLECRTALRVLVPLHEFRATNEDQLYQGVQEVPWDRFLAVDGNFAVDSVVNSAIFRHSHYAALKVKDAIVDQFRNQQQQRPSIDLRHPDLRIHLHIRDEEVSILLDSSGDSLHKRGYRTHKSAAPLNEALAAGMILLSGWKAERPFVDPMCGAGTILLEAALIAAKRAPGLDRRFGFEKWKSFDRALWEELIREARARIVVPEVSICGIERDGTSLLSAEDNLRRAGLEGQVALQQTDFFETSAPTDPGTLVMNPPYGERMQEADMEAFYKQIGDQFKQHYQDFEAWIISSNLPAMKRVGLRPFRKHTLFNGPLECRYYGYQLYKGSREE